MKQSPAASGGELREIAVMCTDLAGFTTLSERLTPQLLVALVNRHLSTMTEQIEAEGGFVDKFTGDGLLAMFGAPIDNAGCAAAALRAALACRTRLDEENAAAETSGGKALRVRIGVALGEALVGNIGGRRRFNYTAMGDVTNLASRLEGVNKIYGTTLLVADTVQRAAADSAEWREIDRVRVVGRDQPVTLFEPLALAGQASAALRALAAAYAEALALYRHGAFAEAAAGFAALAAADPPSRVMAERARTLAATPPSAPWDGVTSITSK
jgi:adenylate cyclase